MLHFLWHLGFFKKWLTDILQCFKIWGMCVVLRMIKTKSRSVKSSELSIALEIWSRPHVVTNCCKLSFLPTQRIFIITNASGVLKIKEIRHQIKWVWMYNSFIKILFNLYQWNKWKSFQKSVYQFLLIVIKFMKYGEMI